jgi:outer membrane protein OmpA-like peptidoglycan-associated protein
MRIFLYLISLFSSILLSAQAPKEYSTTNKKAIKQYESGLAALDSKQYETSISLLKNAIESDPQFIEPNLLLFEVYSETRDINNAIASLETAIKINSNYYPNAFFFLANLQFNTAKYEAAKLNFKKFNSFERVNPEMKKTASKITENCEFAIDAMSHPVPFEPINMGESINTNFSEYYPSLTADDNTFLFTRRIESKGAIDQEDFYISTKDENGKWQIAKPLTNINSTLNEGAPTLSPDGQTLVFTACEMYGDYGEGRKGEGSCDLFYAYKVGDQWTKPKNMGKQINTSNWETQPSLSSDGSTLYFVRGINTREGIQQQDIYSTHLADDGSWTKPEKLSNVINTPEVEESVMIHPDGRTLYFSSNGHPGMGGLDIFKAVLQDDGSWSKPENLGYPINTNDNENSLLVSSDGKLAYFASNRDSNNEKLDLYSFELPEKAKPNKITYAKGIVFDKQTSEKLEARFELVDVETNQIIVQSFSNKGNGEFLITLPAGKTYAMNVSKAGYLFYSENFELKETKDGKPFLINVPLSKIAAGETVVLKNIFFDTDQFELKTESKTELDKLIQFLKVNPAVNLEIGGHTDNQGVLAKNMLLSENRAKAVYAFLVNAGVTANRLKTKGYADKNPISSNDTELGKAKNRRTEIKVL